MKKKIILTLATLMALVCMLGIFVLSASAASSNKIIHSGTSGSLKWSIKENGEFILEGNGSLADENFGTFGFDKYGVEHFYPTPVRPWLDYKDKIVHAKIRVKNAKSLCGILNDCYNLETVDFTGSDTSKTIDFACIFAAEYAWNGKTNKIKKLDLSMLDTSNVVRMTQLFWGCTNLEYVNVTGWDTSNVTEMGSLFDCCLNLKKIDGLQNWNTSNVYEMYTMFQCCQKLEKLDLSKWNTSKLQTAYSMFNYCQNLQSLNVSTWDVSKVSNFYDFFSCNTKLKNLDLTNWNMESATCIDNMFGWCYELSGGITFNSKIKSYNNAFYATSVYSEKPFEISYKEKCTKELAEKIYNTNGYDAENLKLIHCPKGHKYVTVTTKATLTKNGKIETKCSVCGNVKSKTTYYYPKTISLSATKFTYNGNVKGPAVTVKDSNGKALVKGTDYTVKYSDGRKNVGKYTVTVTFKGNYSGTKTLTFYILPGKTSKITPTATTTTLKATWNKVTGATGYKVEFLNAKGKVIKTVTTKNLTYTFSKLSAGTTYKIKVTAYKTISEKNQYSLSSTTLTTATKPATPTLKVSSIKKGIANLSWSNVAGETGYQVYYSTSKNGTYTKIGVYNANTIKGSKSKLTSGKTYYFKVRAYKKVGDTTIFGAWSSVKSVKVK